MKTRLAIVLIVIVLAPIGLLGWLGFTIAQNEQGRAREQYARVLSGRLDDIRNNMAGIISKQERELLSVLSMDFDDTEQMRKTVRHQRLVKQMFLLDAKGKLVYPGENKNDLTQGEESFLQRTKELRDNGEIFYNPGENETDVVPEHGWHSWFSGEGISLIFWKHLRNGEVIGIEVERSALVADIIGNLPYSAIINQNGGGRHISLLDAGGQILYQWGTYSPSDDAKPNVVKSAPLPLQAWRLQYYAEDIGETKLFESSTMFNIVSGLSIIGVALMALAFYFYRESLRDMREASHRVSFVNQVSHELKTPLTNIRMYAELLEQRMAKRDDKSRYYVNVLTSESSRLSRLITNVLTFGKSNRKSLKLRVTVGLIDDVVNSVVGTFEPVLTALGIAIKIEGRATGQVLFDADVLEQILGNLISNVEKYAASATHVTVSLRQTEDQTKICVCDNGPGIPDKMREAVFQPFVRLSNKLSDGVSGTGIGLSIARDLARLHGGDLILKSSATGAIFELTLNTPMEIRDENSCS